MKQISILIPVKDEEENVEKLYNKIITVLHRQNGKSFEIIFIDDGSTDNTAAELKKLAKKDKKVRVIIFRRNFGKSAALVAGSKQATGDIIVTMDGDLQDDPSEIPKFIEKIEEGYDVVVGWKFPRNDPFSKIFFSKIFNFLTSRIAGLKLHDYNCGFKAYKKETIDNLTLYGDLHRYIAALLYWKGYKVSEVKIKHCPRTHGKSKYGTSRIIKGFFDLLAIKFIQKYRKTPLLFFGVAGASLVAIGGLISAYLFSLFLYYGSLNDRPLIFLAMLLVLLGVQFLSIGLLGVLIVNATIKPEESFEVKEIVN
jgi:glycosyltransferase involved in cell wall biosynthesis